MPNTLNNEMSSRQILAKGEIRSLHTWNIAPLRDPGPRLLDAGNGGGRQRSRATACSAPEKALIRKTGKDLVESAKRPDLESAWRRDVAAAEKHVQRILVLAQIDRLATGKQQIDRVSAATIGKRFNGVIVGCHGDVDPFPFDDVQQRAGETATGRSGRQGADICDRELP